MAHIIAESRFAEPLSEEEERMRSREIDLQLDSKGRGFHWLRSFCSQDRKRIISEFEATDAESIRAAYQAAGFPVEECWLAVVHSSETASAD